MKRTVRFLNVDIQSITQEELLRSLSKGTLITPNVDHLVKLQRIKSFIHSTRRLNGLFVIAKFSI